MSTDTYPFHATHVLVDGMFLQFISVPWVDVVVKYDGISHLNWSNPPDFTACEITITLIPLFLFGPDKLFGSDNPFYRIR